MAICVLLLLRRRIRANQGWVRRVADGAKWRLQRGMIPVSFEEDGVRIATNYDSIARP
jgi:hypothetical protein